MAASITFDFLSKGGPELARQFKGVGDNAGLAARGAKVLQDVIKTLGEKENRTAAESRTLAAALRQTGDAEDRAAAKALAADIAIRRLDDALKDSGKNAASAKGGFAGLAGEITGFGAAAGVADSKSSLFTKALAGLNLASGVLEPALAGVVVAAGGLAAGFAAAGAGLGVFGAVAKTVFSEASKAATAYAAAQAKYASATTSKQRTAALNAEKAAFAGLSPPVRKLAVDLGNTQKMWKAFTDAAAPGVVGVISRGLGLLPKILASMKPFLAPVETALRGIIGQLNTGLSSAGFKSFTGALAANAGPAITKIATAIGNVVVGIGGILKAFLPTSQTMLSGIDKITAKFRQWGTTLSSHSGFASLMATFRSETPQAVAILKNLGTVIANVGKAMFGLSTFSNSKALLNLLLPLSGVLASLSKNTALTRIALYLIAAGAAARKLGPAFTGIRAAVAFFPAAAAAVAAFAGAAEGATVAETIAAAATRAWGLAMDALPWVALAAAVVAVAILIIKYHRQIWAFVQRVWHDILGAIMAAWNWVRANWPLLLGILTGPIGLAAVEIIKHWHDIQHALGTVLAAITTAWNAVWGALRTAFRIFIVNGVLDPLGWIVHGAAAAFGWIPKIGDKLKGAAKAFDQFKANVNASLGGINGRTVNVSVAMTSSTNPYPGGISGRKAAGGKITGPGGPRADTAGVFALSNGEWVIQSQSAARYGPAAMSAVNEGKAVIGYAAGGGVGVNVNAQTPSAKSIDAMLMGSVTKLATAFAKTFLGSGPAIVAYARQFLGQIPYVMGGNSLSGGIDCCIIGSMHVQTIRGPVEIRDIQAGDEVYTWNDGKPSVNRVTWRSEPRYQQVYRLRTIHREITASGNHPFLTLRKTGRCAPPDPRFPERELQSYAERVPRPAAAPEPGQARQRARRRDYQQVDAGKIRDLYLAGSSMDEIATALGISVHTVWTRLDETGTPRRRRVNADAGKIRDLYLGGASLTEIGGMLGISVSTVTNRLDETGTPRRPAGAGTAGRPVHTTRNDYALSWVNLEDLRRGDVIVTLKSLPDDAPAPDDPLLADPRFLWLLGLAFGDGTLTGTRPNRVTLCVFGDLRDEVQDRLEDFCGKRGTPTATNGLRLHSEILASGLRRYGMGAGSTERVVPRELWTLPHSHIQAFLDGYTAADGHRVKRAGDPALSYKAANRGLVEDVRNLHMILGHNVTRVRELKRTRPIVIRGKEVKNARSLWTFEAYETGVKTTALAINLRRHPGISDLFAEDSHFAPQRVTSIEPLGTEDTYDITVEDTHNFVAEGLVVHNSGFTQQVYSHFGIHAPRTSETQFAWVRRTGPVPGGLAFYVSPAGGPPPGHVAIVQDGNSVISQGGGMGPTIMGLHAMPLMGTGIPPSGFGGAGGSGGNGPAMPAASGSIQAIAMSLLKQYGWGNQWNSFNALEMHEAGWNMTARNPSSGAYGLAQFINGPSEYFQYGGNPNTALGQLTAMDNYIASRYGSPNAAWAQYYQHPGGVGYYANGTPSAARGWAVVGERGPELVRFSGGEQVIPGMASGGSVAAKGAADLRAWRAHRQETINLQIEHTSAALHTASVLAGARLPKALHAHYVALAARDKAHLNALTAERTVMRDWRSHLAASDATLHNWIAAAGKTKSLQPSVRAWKHQLAGQEHTIGEISLMLGLTTAQLKAYHAALAAAAKAKAKGKPPVPTGVQATHTYGGDVTDTIGAFLAAAASPFTGTSGVSMDRGGWLRPGWNPPMYNGLGRPEPVGAARGGGTVRLEISSGGSSAFDQFMLTMIRKYVRVKGGTGPGATDRAFAAH